MNSRQKIQIKLAEYLEKMIDLKSTINFNVDEEAAHKAIKNIISLLNKAYPLTGYINPRFQEDLLMNLREFEHRYYIQVDAWPYYDTCVSILERIINIIETENEFGDLIPTQKYYSRNQKFSVLSNLDSIFRNAKTELVYYDQYMDHVLVEAMSDLEVTSIKLILASPNEKFKLFIEELKKERAKNITYIELKDKEIHDRYCLIDGTELWQISGSINVKNLNSITITKVIEEDAHKKIIADLNKIINI
jgi:hypothetical protein